MGSRLGGNRKALFATRSRTGPWRLDSSAKSAKPIEDHRINGPEPHGWSRCEALGNGVEPPTLVNGEGSR
ncbi:hypothetical protein LIER_27379 [Lithospermum erythrorhizon]|uniref:Uncharacterized protein n=1 Tax=Lithospermum erythrorhizon TaxID=34254 RepID=A0AAV3RC42_LITER